MLKKNNLRKLIRLFVVLLVLVVGFVIYHLVMPPDVIRLVKLNVRTGQHNIANLYGRRDPSREDLLNTLHSTAIDQAGTILIYWVILVTRRSPHPARVTFYRFDHNGRTMPDLTLTAPAGFEFPDGPDTIATVSGRNGDNIWVVAAKHTGNNNYDHMVLHYRGDGHYLGEHFPWGLDDAWLASDQFGNLYNSFFALQTDKITGGKVVATSTITADSRFIDVNGNIYNVKQSTGLPVSTRYSTIDVVTVTGKTLQHFTHRSPMAPTIT